MFIPSFPSIVNSGQAVSNLFGLSHPVASAPSSDVSGDFSLLPSPDSVEEASGSYLDDGSQTSAEKAADENLGFLNQLIGSLTGENQRILQNLMAEAAKAQYDYSERMSNTAYQRAVKDMKAAGLNPAVMFMNGAGSSASTPSVGVAQVATENQLLGMFSSAGSLLSGIGSLLGSILGKNGIGVIADWIASAAKSGKHIGF